MGRLIVFAGDTGAGKSYITHLTENTTKRVMGIHKKDFITIKLCRILKIHPAFIGWGFCKFQYIIDRLFVSNEEIEYANNTKDMKFIMTTFFGCPDSTLSNELLVPDLHSLYTLTDLIWLEYNAKRKKERKQDLKNELNALKFIVEEYGGTIIYHATEKEEISVFNNKNIPCIFIHSDDHFKQHYRHDIDLSPERKSDLDIMEEKCDYKIINNISLNSMLKSKLPNILYMIEKRNFAKFI